MRQANMFVALLLTALLRSPVSLAQSGNPLSSDEQGYYAKWVGVSAPPIGSNAKVGLNGPPITIEEFRGKRLFLFSFDAGNFVGGGRPHEKIAADLKAVNGTLSDAGAAHMAAVGFTEGVCFFFPEDNMSQQMRTLRRVPSFPLINLTNRRFGEPYSLLNRPSGIVIDRNGVIVAVYPHEMSPVEITGVAGLPDWTGETRGAPLPDPWDGKAAPTPTRTFAEAWKLPFEGARVLDLIGRRSSVIALGHGKWIDDHDLVLAVDSAGKMRAIASDGTVKQELALRPSPSPVSTVIQCSEIRRGEIVAFQLPEGWPREIPLIGPKGRSLWAYQHPDNAGLDSIACADLDGDGCSEVIVGCNGSAGLCVVDCENKPRWKDTSIGNVWEVVGFDATGGRPGLVLCASADGAVRVFDAKGKQLRKMPRLGKYCSKFAAAEMNPRGDRQILSYWQAEAGSSDFIAATDMNGNLLWKFPIELPHGGPMHGAIRAAEITGDGTKEWIVASASNELVVLDADGKLVARLAVPKGSSQCWTPVSRAGKPGLLVVSNSKGIVAHALAAP